MSKVFATLPGDLCSILGRALQKTQITILDTSLLNTHHFKEACFTLNHGC